MAAAPSQLSAVARWCIFLRAQTVSTQLAAQIWLCDRSRMREPHVQHRSMQSDAVHRNIKPQILSAFGDIALAIGDSFETYLQHVITMLGSAQVPL
jgi:hypothetical protein